MGTQDTLLFPTAHYMLTLNPGQNPSEQDIIDLVQAAHDANPWESRDPFLYNRKRNSTKVWIHVKELAHGQYASTCKVEVSPQYVMSPSLMHAYIRYAGNLLNPKVRPDNKLRIKLVEGHVQFDANITPLLN